MRYLKSVVVSLVIGVLGVLLLSAIALPDEQHKIVVGIDPAYPPWTTIDEAGEIVGFDIDLFAAVAEAGGIDFKFQPLPWEISITSLQKGVIDVLVGGMVVKCDRMKIIDYAAPYLATVRVLVSKPGVELSEVLFNGATIGGLAGDAAFNEIVAYLQEIGVNVKKREYETSLFAVEDLKLGRLNAVAMSMSPAGALIEAGQDIVVAVKFLIAGDQIAWGVTKGDPYDVIRRINAGLGQVFESGQYAEMLHKWFPWETVPSKVPLPLWIDCSE